MILIYKIICAVCVCDLLHSVQSLTITNGKNTRIGNNMIVVRASYMYDC